MAQHARAGVVLHPLHRGLGRHAARNRLLHAPDPAAVAGEHAVGIEHVAVLAGAAQVALLHQLVDGGLQIGERRVEPARLGLRVLRLKLGHHQARVVQHHVPHPQPFRQGLAAHHDVAAATGDLHARADPGDGPGHEVLGQHHGRGLQHLDVLVGVLPMGPVLDGEDAHHLTVADDRHRQERVVDLLARLGPVGEGRVVLRVGLVDGRGLLGAASHQPLAAPQQGVVGGARVQALGGEQLKRAVLALQVDRAHLGHHQAGDLAHDLVEPGLAVGMRLGHDLPQPPHDDAQRRLAGNDGRVAAALPLHHATPSLSTRCLVELHAPRQTRHAFEAHPHPGKPRPLSPDDPPTLWQRRQDREISPCPARTGRAACAPPARRRPRRSTR